MLELCKAGRLLLKDPLRLAVHLDHAHEEPAIEARRP